MDNNSKQNNNNKNNENKKTHINYRAYIPWLLVDKTWQASILWQMDPLGTRAYMPWLLVDKTWQTIILWQMDPRVRDQRCLEYQPTNIGRELYFGRWNPLPPPDKLDSGMKYQLLLWDEVYRLWYFNDHITTLVISEKILYDIYWRYKETNQDFPSIL